MLEIKHFKLIEAIANTGNVTSAARKLFVTQSALSQQLKEVENRLNTPVFSRSKKKMILTPVGKKLLKTAHDIIEQVQDIEIEIEKIICGETGELKVGTQCVFCYKWLPGVLAEFHENHPGIEFELGNSSDPVKDLTDSEFDVVVTVSEKIPDTFRKIHLFSDQLVCVLPDWHPFCSRTHIQWQDFRELSLIAHSDRSHYRFHQEIFKPENIMPKRFMAVGQPQAMIEMVAAGIGASIFPKWALKSALDSYPIKAIPITRQGLPVNWSAVFAHQETLPAYHREFVRIISRMYAKGRLLT